jgi:cytochrome c556
MLPHCTRVLPLAALLVAVCGAGAVHAQAQPTKAEQLLKYRKAVYQTIVWNFGPMSAMRAGRVAALTPMIGESYAAESRDVAGSKAKPELWSNRADFDARLKTLVERSAVLAKVAQGGDEAASRAAFLDTAGACKACHEKYRAD